MKSYFLLILICIFCQSCGPLKDIFCSNLNETVRAPRNPDKYQKIYAKERTKKVSFGDFEFAKGADAEISTKIVQLTEKFNQSNISFELASSKLIYLTAIRPCAEENYAQQLAKLSSDFVTVSSELESLKTRQKTTSEEVEKVIDKVEKETKRLDSLSKKTPTTPENPIKPTEKNITVGLYGLNYSQSGFEKVKKKLSSLYSVVGSYNFKGRQDWLAFKSTVFYYDKESEAKAREIAKLIQNEIGITTEIRIGAGLGINQDKRATEFRVHLIN